MRQDTAFATVDEVENGEVIDFADDEQMSSRQTLADEFYDALGMIDDENRPFFVSDDAALYDVQMEDDDFVVVAVQRHYGITLRVPEDFNVRSRSCSMIYVSAERSTGPRQPTRDSRLEQVRRPAVRTTGSRQKCAFGRVAPTI
jgi:hypothetical protein